MKAKLTVKEVGGLRGEHVYELESGKTWLLKSSNSGGKTSLLRALSAVLSVPQDGDFGKYPREEAIKLGIQTEDVSPKEGFVNVHSKQAEVTLEIGDVTSKYIVTRDGNYISLPHNGDPRFLLAGVISNNSKILRQLRNVDGRDQPDDFEWAVRELSKAARYEDILNLLKNKRDEYSNQVITVNRKVKDRERLEKEETNLIQEKTKLDKKLDDTKFEDTNIEELIKKREKLIEKIDNKRTAISDEETKIKGTKGKLNEIEKSIKIIQKENKEYEAELKKFDLEKIKKNKEKREKEIQEEVNKLIDERNALDGLLNLLITAQASMRKEKEKTKCPLCEDGKITYNLIVKRVDSLRDDKDKFNGKILELNTEKEDLIRGFDKNQKRIEELKYEIKDRISQEETEKSRYANIKAALSGCEDIIQKYQGEAENFNKQKEDVDKELGPHGDLKKLLDELDKKRENISEKLGTISQQLFDTNIELNGKEVKPKIALKILNLWNINLEELIKYAEKRADEQKQMAASQFNQNIKEMMETLNFKEFKTIKLNNKYKLYVERLNPKTKDYVIQEVNTLSTSEMLSIALILQIALKETYIPDTPFFIIDDVMEDYDETRAKTILKYLKNKAKEKNWCVIVTKLAEDVKTPTLSIME